MLPKMIRKSRKQRLVSEINITPFTDVILVLLVIFMITTPLLSQGVKVELPQAAAEALTSESEEPIIISVDKEGLYYLNVSNTPERAMPPQQLATQVAAYVKIATDKQQKRLVLVKGDQQVAYEKVVTVMALLTQAGVKQVGLMTQNPPGATLA